MKPITYIFIIITLTFVSCSQSSLEDTLNGKLFSVIDTLSRLDYLFSVKEIQVSDKGILKSDFSNICTRDRFGNFYFKGYDQAIYKLDKNGTVVKRFEASGHGPGEYISIDGIITDKDGNIYVSNSEGRNIIKYDSCFNYILSIKLKSLNPPNSFDINSDNNLICYHSSEPDAAIFIYNTKTGEYIDKYGSGDALEFKFNSPNCARSLNVDGQKYYYIHAHEYKIYEVDESGDLTTITPSSTSGFKVINSNSPNPFIARKYSFIIHAMLMKGLFFINIKSPDMENKPGMNFDLVTKEGDVLKKRMQFGNVWWLNKVDDHTFLSLNYEKQKRSNQQVISLYTLDI